MHDFGDPSRLLSCAPRSSLDGEVGTQLGIVLRSYVPKFWQCVEVRVPYEVY